MDDKFLIAIHTILKHEGGYVNHPNDPGGETNWGISKRQYPNLNIKNLTKKQAIQIYYNDYWKPYKYFMINDIKIATKIFDMTVNMGPANAASITHNALQLKTSYRKIGPKTRALINKHEPNSLLKKIQNAQWQYYNKKIEKNPSLAAFKKGWKNRAFS